MSSPALPVHSGRTLVRLRYAAPKIFATFLALLLAAIWIGPLALMVITSIKPNKEFLNGPFALPIAPTGNPHVIRGAWTAVFRRIGGRWVIVMEHLSTPPSGG